MPRIPCFQKVLFMCVTTIVSAAADITISTTPRDGYRFFEGDTIEFEVVLTDSEGSALTVDTAVWNSDQVGEIGRGISFATHLLSKGRHAIAIQGNAVGGIAFGDTIEITIHPYDSVNVYCVGGNNGQGVYWVNGILHEVANVNTPLHAVCSHGGDLYFAAKGVSRHVARYWRNGDLVELRGKYYNNTNDIAISNGEILIAGSFADSTTNNQPRACFWKSGNLHQLPSSGFAGEAVSIAIADSMIYITGWEQPGREMLSVPILWVNGVRHYLPAPANDYDDTLSDTTSEARFVCTRSGVPYVAGYDTYPVADDYGSPVWWYWQNGSKSYLVDESGISPLEDPYRSMWVESFAAGQLGVFACGAVMPGVPSPVWYLWKDGVSRKWTELYDDRSAGWELFVLHSHLFSGGQYVAGVGENEYLAPCYWRNEKRYDLPGGESKYRIYDICAEVVTGSNTAAKNPQKDLFDKERPIDGTPYLEVDRQGNGNVEIHYRIPKHTDISLEILSPQGRQIHRQSLEHKGAGLHSLTLSLGQRSCGVYTVRLLYGDKALTQKLLIAR